MLQAFTHRRGELAAAIGCPHINEGKTLNRIGKAHLMVARLLADWYLVDRLPAEVFKPARNVAENKDLPDAILDSGSACHVHTYLRTARAMPRLAGVNMTGPPRNTSTSSVVLSTSQQASPASTAPPFNRSQASQRQAMPKVGRPSNIITEIVGLKVMPALPFLSEAGCNGMHGDREIVIILSTAEGGLLDEASICKLFAGWQFGFFAYGR